MQRETFHRISRLPFLLISVLLVCLSTTLIAQQTAVENKTPPTERQTLEQRLAKYLTNTRWTGNFTINGKDTAPKPEVYEITQATKADKGDFWNLVARIKYGDKDITLPLPPIEIKWAGETPVITVDQVSIPGMGTFDARVVIRSGQYAGVWKHDKVGGHLFGTIEKMDEKATE